MEIMDYLPVEFITAIQALAPIQAFAPVEVLAAISLLAAAVLWLLRRQSALSGQIKALQTAVSELQPTNADAVETAVSGLIDELRTVADSACREVTSRIEELRAAQIHAKSRIPIAEPRELPVEPRKKGHELLPVIEIARLAAEGMSPSDIARQIGTGVAEVELALRVRRSRISYFRCLPDAVDARYREAKEVSLACEG
jgi:hypothetical protein